MRYIWIILVSLLANFNLAGQEKLPDQVMLSYSCYNKPLRIVLKDLSKITGVSLVYSENRIPAEKLIKININNQDLGSTLTVLLDDYDLKYQIVGDQIVLVRTVLKNSESNYTISGYIRDLASKEYLIGANVFLHDKSKGTNTNEYGFYSFKVPRETKRIHFTYLGYKNRTIEFYVSQDTILNIMLEPDGLLNEILISEKTSDELRDSPIQKEAISINKVLNSNTLLGEADVLRYMSMQPGVTTGADGIGGMNVRGGSADQNLVLMDGVPIFNTGHALGIFSVFNASALKSINFYKGTVPARYGGRLSSVLDIQTKDGNMQKTSAEVSLSSIALKASVNGPIFKDKVSYLVSFRRTFLDVWIKELTKYQNRESGNNGSSNYYFYDFNGKLNFQLSENHRLIFSVFQGSDNFLNTVDFLDNNVNDKKETSLNWGNKVYSMRLSSRFNKNIFGKFTAYKTNYNIQSYQYSRFELFEQQSSKVDFLSYLFDSQISESGLKYEIDFIPSSKHYIKGGLSYYNRIFSPATTTISDATHPQFINTEFSIDTIKNMTFNKGAYLQEAVAYLEDEIVLSENIQLHAGVHFSMLDVNEQDEKVFSIQPRLSFLAQNENLNFRIGAAKMQQFMHLLTNNGLGLPTDIWIAASKDLLPQQAWVFNTALEFIPKPGNQIGLELYYKKMENLTSFKEGEIVDIRKGLDWSKNIPVGEGFAYGTELYFNKISGKSNFNINYGYSISNRVFPNLNVGRVFPFNYNRTHSFKFTFSQKLSEFSEFVLNWTYASGNHYSKPDNVLIDINGKIVLFYPEKNNQRFDDYHRLDLGFSFYNKFRWGKTKLFLGLYNAYNRKNYFFVDIDRNRRNPNNYELNQYNLLPITPTFSYTIFLD